MPDYRKMFPPSAYLANWELEGEATVEILKVVFEEVQSPDGTKEKKPVVHFKDAKKGMILSKTKGRAIAKICGSLNTEDWPGHKITLYRDPTYEAFGEVTGQICVKETR